MEYHLDFNSCVYLLKSGAKNIPLNSQMVSLWTKYFAHCFRGGPHLAENVKIFAFFFKIKLLKWPFKWSIQANLLRRRKKKKKKCMTSLKI